MSERIYAPESLFVIHMNLEGTSKPRKNASSTGWKIRSVRPVEQNGLNVQAFMMRAPVRMRIRACSHHLKGEFRSYMCVTTLQNRFSSRKVQVPKRFIVNCTPSQSCPQRHPLRQGVLLE